MCLWGFIRSHRTTALVCVKNKWNLQITDYSLHGCARVHLAACVCERAVFLCRDGGERGHFNEGMFSCVFVAQAARKRLCRPPLPGGCCISGDGEGRCQVDCVLAWWVSSSKLHWEKCRFFPSLLLLVIFCRLCKRNSRNPGFSKETCHSVNVFEARALDIIYVRGGWSSVLLDLVELKRA